jgi:hypothetical protein
MSVGSNVRQPTEAWLMFSDLHGPPILALAGTGLVVLIVRRGDASATDRWLAVYNSAIAFYLALAFFACVIPYHQIVNVP